ncbi:hypothetical protein FNU79_15010 [Deinococcus detaillensis]|uniref:Uncharacterized protein n=1 Tax=Deinococcus detaillensis TaxID=2592048 RepID=A0A553UMJ1_9DEIO|nr:hypothetical protein [Deinococcus detaillensis]TSA81438.1 hypothetical protein FNU79_15010 [Deinococcus detaillensis]
MTRADEYNAVTEAPKAVRVQLARLGINQAELERRLGVKPSVVSRALNGSPLDQRSTTWPAMLEELGLEVVIRPKDKASTAEFDAAETAAVLADHPEILERLKRLERDEEEFFPIEEVAAKYGVKL